MQTRSILLISLLTPITGLAETSPLIGAGSGGFNQRRSRAIMEDELQKFESPLEITIVVPRQS
jgi:hypothetical protein